MDPPNQELSRFTALPRDMIAVILAKLGVDSPVDFHNAIRSCKEIHTCSDNRLVYRRLSLAPLVKKPLAASGYQKTMEKCLAQNNPDANYIKGMVEYFHKDDVFTGLDHFQYAADAGKKEAIYIHAVLLLCNGLIEEGEEYFAKLNWTRNMNTVNVCWRNVKASLHGITVRVKRRYMRNLRKMKPANACHPNDMDNTCAKCFHYKRMKMFVYMM